MKGVLQDYNLAELEELALEYGEKKYRAKQLFEGLMQGKRISDIPVSAALREKILERFEDEPVKIRETFVSGEDGTKKFLFELADGNLIEGVFMRYKYGNTQCVSTQVGCRMGCKFCASALGGLVRNLSAGEILSQILAVNRSEGGTLKDRAVTNVVLMGSGEPFDNYDNVIRFIKNVSSEGGICISPRNVSLSTCGLVPQMKKFAEEGLPVNLTISLHASSDEERRRTMPVANAYSIPEIMDACTYYFKKTGRRITFEYSLMDGVNDTKEDAERLVLLAKPLGCHVNLIPVNPVKERHFARSDVKKIEAFKNKLEKNKINVTIRREMGRDIDGACGQLRRRHILLQGE